MSTGHNDAPPPTIDFDALLAAIPEPPPPPEKNEWEKYVETIGQERQGTDDPASPPGSVDFHDLFQRPPARPEGTPWEQDLLPVAIKPERARLLFEPAETPAAPESEELPNYDFLFTDEPIVGSIDSDPHIPSRPEQTEQGRVNSRRVFRYLLGIGTNSNAGQLQPYPFDERFAEIIEQYAEGHTLPSDQDERLDTLIDAVHHDGELRLAVGLHFLGKLEHYVSQTNPITGGLAHRVPDRIRANHGYKKPHKPHGALDDRMTSREYVALLCVDMIDGTFNPDDERGQPTEDYRNGGDFQGQHRWMARQLLEGYEIRRDGTYK